MYREITFDEIRKNEEIASYVASADQSLSAMGYTEHSFAHVLKCASVVRQILGTFGYSPREINLGQIAAYMHDIGNNVNRYHHGLTGGTMAFNILSRLEMDPKDIALIIAAIGNHDEAAAYPVNNIAAALLIADKTDVRRSRVREEYKNDRNIHNRVNYAVFDSSLDVHKKEDGTRIIALSLTIDTKVVDIMDYFQIFMSRMELCKLAASKLNARFKLIINGLELI